MSKVFIFFTFNICQIQTISLFFVTMNKSKILSYITYCRKYQNHIQLVSARNKSILLIKVTNVPLIRVINMNWSSTRISKLEAEPLYTQIVFKIQLPCFAEYLRKTCMLWNFYLSGIGFWKTFLPDSFFKIRIITHPTQNDLTRRRTTYIIIMLVKVNENTISLYRHVKTLREHNINIISKQSKR